MNKVAYYFTGALVALVALPAVGAVPAYAGPKPACQLTANGNRVKHIVYSQFDNVHLRRDNSNVPSDLEQMPNLLHFMEQEGTLLTNHHTPIISQSRSSRNSTRPSASSSPGWRRTVSPRTIHSS